MALRCERESHQYDYTYTPSYSFDHNYDLPKFDYDTSIDKSKKAIDELMTADAAWSPAVQAVDPIDNAANTKNLPCTALSGIDEEPATFQVAIMEELMADSEALDTEVKSPYPLSIIGEEDTLDRTSPEAAAKSADLLRASLEGGTMTTPSLKTKDLLLQVMKMPKPSKTVKRVKGIAPGTPIVKGWVYDHIENRVVCAGVIAIPKPGKGDKALLLSDDQITKLVKAAPDAMRFTPPPLAEAPAQ
jgi:hypothetical protein